MSARRPEAGRRRRVSIVSGDRDSVTPPRGLIGARQTINRTNRSLTPGGPLLLPGEDPPGDLLRLSQAGPHSFQLLGEPGHLGRAPAAAAGPHADQPGAPGDQALQAVP